MEQIARLQYANLSAAQQIALSSSLQFIENVEEGRLSFATGCSGTDVISHALNILSSLWQETYGIAVKPDHIFSAEIVDWKRAFITRHWQPKFLFQDVNDLSKDTIKDVKSGNLVAPPAPMVALFGFECDSISGLNAQSKGNRGCVALNTERTGSTANAVLGYARKTRVPVLILENVKNLNASNGSNKSDMQSLIGMLNRLGYHVTSALLKATEYGIPQTRDRLYLFAVLMSLDPIDQTSEDFPRPPHVTALAGFLNSCRIDALPLSRFLVLDGAEALSEWRSECQARHEDDVTEPVSKARKVQKRPNSQPREYEVDHLQAFQQAHMAWPPTFTDSFLERTVHLSQRMKEIVFYDQATVNESDEEAIRDLNMSFNWGSWQLEHSPCVVSTSHMWLRKRGTSMAPSEALALQGFSHCVQKTCEPPLSCAQTMDLAGNAFNGAVCLAATTAVVGSLDWSLLLALHRECSKAQEGGDERSDPDDSQPQSGDEDHGAFATSDGGEEQTSQNTDSDAASGSRRLVPLDTR